MKRNDLNSLFWLRAEIREDTRRLHELEAAAEPQAQRITGMPGGEGDGRSLERIAIQCAELRDAIEKKREAAIVEETRLTAVIANEPDAQMRLIMQLRHIRLLSWHNVARRMGGQMTEDAVKQIYHRYLKEHWGEISKSNNCHDCHE